ncbi:MAG: hypothetical protein V4819_03430 [Verrucomicrobiota bacterium]
MNEKHRDSLKQYVNDMIGLERDITNAVKLQADDDRVRDFGTLKGLLDAVVQASEGRMEILKQLSDQEDGSLGGVVKEGITAVAGTLAGIYGKMREHPVSRMVRDDIIALDVTSVSYGMLLTLGLSIGHDECAALATRGIDETPPLIIALTDLLPMIVAEELAADAPLVNPAAVQVARARIRDSWNIG